MSDRIVRWLNTAPRGVVLTICVSMCTALAGWTWTLAGEQRLQQTDVAVATATAQQAKEIADAVNARTDSQYTRINDKLDKLLEAVANLQAADAAKRRKEK